MAMRLAMMAMCAVLVSACEANAPEESAGGSATRSDGLSAEEMAEAASEIERPEPGLYRSVMSVTEIDLPGAPPEALGVMQQMVGQQTPQEFCLTEEDARRGFEEMVRNAQGNECTYERFDVDDGEISARAVCSGDDGGSSTITLSGTGGRTASDMTMRMDGQVQGLGEGSMTFRVRSERIGDCPA
jgi:hypothetical protein